VNSKKENYFFEKDKITKIDKNQRGYDALKIK
jgi:hypothetical protein